MKLLILSLIMTLNITAQYHHELSFTLSLDPMMLIKGPGHDYTETSSLDWEVKAQYNRRKWRIGMAYKKHRTINFQKFTWIEFDWKWNNIFIEQLTIYTGIELSDVSRHYPDANYLDGNNYIENLTTNFLPGIQGAIEYRIRDGRAGFSLEGSIYQAEEKQREYEKLRFDVTAQLIIYFL